MILASQLQGNLTIGDFYEVNQVKMQIIGLDFSTTIVPFAYFPTNINIQNSKLINNQKSIFYTFLRPYKCSVNTLFAVKSGNFHKYTS